MDAKSLEMLVTREMPYGKYKGRINNYLSSEGYDLKKASKEWAERERAAKNEAAPAGSSGK